MDTCMRNVKFIIYGEVNSFKKRNYETWLNDGVYWQGKNYMFRPIAAIFRF